MYGVSLAYALYSLAEFGYRPIMVDWNNVVFVDANAYCEAFRDLQYEDQQIYEAGYLSRPSRSKVFPWNENVFYFQEEVKKDAVVAMRSIQSFLMTTPTFTGQGQQTTFFFGIDPYINKSFYSEYSQAN